MLRKCLFLIISFTEPGNVCYSLNYLVINSLHCP